MRVGEISNAEIERSRSPKGGWSRKTLEAWGVPWPPPKGWRKTITKRQVAPLAAPVEWRPDLIYPSFDEVAAGDAAPVRHPGETCSCGCLATRRVYYRSANRGERLSANDPAVAVCDSCAVELFPTLARKSVA